MPALPPFLEPDVIARGCVEAGLGPRALSVLQSFAQRIAADDALLEPCADAHAAVFDEQGPFSEAVARADAALGTDAELLHALYLLDTLRLVHERQGARGVDAAISRAINERHGVAWLRGARDAEGVPRVQDWLPSWFRLVGSGELYRLGRLEFAPERWDYPYRAYVHETRSDVIALAESGIAFTATGERAIDGAPVSYESLLVEDESGVSGTPIAPHGFALPRRVRLPAAEWRLGLVKGDWMLDMHVPAEGELSLPALKDAYARALELFAEYYPARTFTAFVCDSWLFSSELARLLAPPSNILRWQREGYLLPGDGGHDVFLKFTFGTSSLDLAHAPRDTRLRRALVAVLERGERLRDGVYFLLARDLHRFGNAPYQHAAERALSEAMDGA
jgi:GNAT domain-containint protein